MGEVCTDGRFEIIESAKKRLLEATNIDTRPDELAVLDSLLFRMWQMGWLPGCEKHDSAAAAAIRRPLQKPLTMEEACGSEEPCVYLEQKGFAPIIAADLCYSIYGYYGENFEVEKIGVPKEIYCSDEYGTKLRCWATKPTDAEREAAQWE